MPSRWGSVHHLLRLGLLRPEELVDSTVTVTEAVSRNRIVRVERRNGGGFAIKQPKDASQPDAQSMWTEAAIFWLSAKEPGFGPMARWMPRFFHYDETQKVLTVEFVAPAASLAAKLFGAGVPPAFAAEAGQAFGTLHGAVSLAATAAPSRRLLSAALPWALTLGFADNRYMPPTPAAASVLNGILGRPGVLAAIAQLRASWRTDCIIHGDAKAANVLILDDGSIRLIDWEIAGLGHPLWDVGGFIHSLLVPNPGAAVEPLADAQARSRPLVEAFWQGYRARLPAAGADLRDTALRMAAMRIVQTCLESAHYGVVTPAIPGMIEMAAELLTRPEGARERWRWTA